MKVKCDRLLGNQIMNLARGIAMTSVPVVAPFGFEVIDSFGNSVSTVLTSGNSTDILSESTYDVIMNLANVHYNGNIEVMCVEKRLSPGVVTVGELLTDTGISCDAPATVVATVLQPCTMKVHFSKNAQGQDPKLNPNIITWETRRCVVESIHWDVISEREHSAEYDLQISCVDGYENAVWDAIFYKLAPNVLVAL